jgi:transcriptional pleiotropic regulator of transition state genes
VKTSGIRRQIDDLGRIVIPKEVRRKLFIREGDSLEIFTGEDCIILKKVKTRQNVAEILRDLRDYIDDDGCLSNTRTSLFEKISEFEAEVEKIVTSAENA